jgi:hypothetical protein
VKVLQAFQAAPLADLGYQRFAGGGRGGGDGGSSRVNMSLLLSANSAS